MSFVKLAVVALAGLLLTSSGAPAQNFLADDGQHHTPAQVEAIMGTSYNYVADFAGVGGGVTDNYALFQAACTGAAGGRLFIPAGSYAITVPAATTLCTPASDTVFEGAGKGLTTLTLTVSDTTYANIFALTNPRVTFKNLTINIVTTSTVNTTLFGLQDNNVTIENCSFTGNTVEGVRIGGTATNNDHVELVFTSSALAGSPITISYTVTTGQTTAQIASGLNTAVNANATLTAAGVTGTLDGSFVKINQVDTLIPQASYTKNVTGSATETMTIGPSSNLEFIVIDGTEASDFNMLDTDVTSFSYVILKSNIKTTTNRRFRIRGGYLNRNITGGLNINSPAGVFEGLTIEGVHIGAVGLNDANDLPIALANIDHASVIGNFLYGTYQQNAVHVEESSNQLVISGNRILMTTSSALGTGYNGTCLYFVDNNIGNGTYKPVNDVLISGNQCIGLTANISGYGLWATNTSAAHLRWSVTGNVFSGYAMGAQFDIVNGLALVGNTWSAYSAAGTGVTLASGVTIAEVTGNSIRTYTTALTNAAASARIEGNYGYNPVGVTAAATVGASPATICAGASPETHYFKQAATNTATIALSGNTIGTMSSTTIPVVVELGPNECEVVTWATTAPTYVKSTH